MRRRPIVAICDISGSMSDYTRIFLHFLHALTAERAALPREQRQPPLGALDDLGGGFQAPGAHVRIAP